MKRKLVFVSLVCVLWSETALGAESGGGTVAVANGAAFVLAPGASEGPAVKGARLVPGTRIRTGPGGSVEVAFDDGSRLTVRPSSSLLLSGTKRNRGKNSVVLFFGRVWSKVKSAGTDATSYEVSTPNAVCGVRGTEFETAVAADGTTRVRVTEGRVGVDEEGDEGDETGVGAGEEVEADEGGVDEPLNAEEQAKWDAWEAQKQRRLEKSGRAIVDSTKARVLSRKQKLEGLRAQQQDIEAKRRAAESRVRAGDSDAVAEIRGYNQQLATLADAIADLGDAAASQFGYVDHLADLASMPGVKMVDRKYLQAEAQSLRRVKAEFDKLVAEGTDISIEAMNQMLEDMSGGQRGSLKEKKKGSSIDDLFGGDDPMR